jgi:hypothetical protein
MGTKRAATRAVLAVAIIFAAAPAQAQSDEQPAAPIMVGGYRAANVQDAGVQAAARFAATAIGGTGVSVRTIHSAQQQLVQGMNYKIDFTASNGRRSIVTVYRPLRGEMRVTQQQAVQVQAPAVPMVGGYRNIAATDAGVEAAANFVISELDDEEFELEQIESAQAQVVQGMNYRLRLKLTNGSSVQALVHRPLRGPMRLLNIDIVE